jgi:two-component system response regulator YesN
MIPVNHKRVVFPRKLNPLFFRILLYFWSLLIPILIIGAIFYYNVTEQAERDASRQVELSMSASVRTIDIYLSIIQEASTSFFNDSHIKAFILPFNQYRPEDQLYIQQIPLVLSQIANNIDQIVDNLFAFVDDQKVYTRAGMEGFDHFFDQEYAFADYGKSFWSGQLKKSPSLQLLKPTKVKLINSMDKDAIPIVFSRPVNGNNVVLVASVSSQMIGETILGNSLFTSTHYIVLDANNEVVLNTSSKPLPDGTVERMVANFVDPEISHGEFMIDHTSMAVNYIKSKSHNWKYIAFTPISEFKKTSGPFLTLISIICLVLIIIGIVFSFIFTFNLYNPIRRVVEVLVQQVETEPSQQTNQLEFIGKGISKLIEHNHQFKDKWQTVSREYLDQMLLNLIMGGPATMSGQVEQMLREYNQFTKPYYLCCGIMFGFKPAFYNDVQDVDRLRILDNLKRIILGFFSPYMKLHVLEEKEYHYICMINLDNQSELDVVHKAIKNLLDAFRHDSQYCRIHIGVGNMHPTLQGMVKSCEEALNALMDADGEIDFQVIDSRSEHSINRNFAYSFTDEKMIIDCLQAGDLAILRNRVDGIISKNEKKGASAHIISLLIYEMYNTGKRLLLEKEGHDPALFAADNDRMELNGLFPDFFDYQEKKQLLLVFFGNVIKKIAETEQMKQKLDSLVPTIIQYIEDNYQHDLHLELIADRMGFSTKYLSKLFHDKTGDYLSGYINQYRITKAKELLVESDLSVNEISERVGIFSRTTFIRLFKKYEEVTPKEYRRLYQMRN